MAQGVQDFYEQIQQRNLLRKHQFRIIHISGMNLLEDDLVLATTATLPGKEISTKEVKFGGSNFKVPSTAKYEQTWNITFHATEDFFVRDEFERWMDSIYDIEANGRIGNGGAGDYSISGKERMVQMVLLNSQLNIIRHYYLVGAFPTKMSPLEFDAQSDGDLMTQTFTMAYQYYTVSPGDGAPAGSDGILGRIQRGLRTATRIGNTVEQFGKTIDNVLKIF